MTKGRPKLELDRNAIAYMLKIGATKKHIQEYCKIAKSTLYLYLKEHPITKAELDAIEIKFPHQTEPSESNELKTGKHKPIGKEKIEPQSTKIEPKEKTEEQARLDKLLSNPFFTDLLEEEPKGDFYGLKKNL